MMMGHRKWVMRVMGRLCDESHESPERQTYLLARTPLSSSRIELSVCCSWFRISVASSSSWAIEQNQPPLRTQSNKKWNKKIKQNTVKKLFCFCARRRSGEGVGLATGSYNLMAPCCLRHVRWGNYAKKSLDKNTLFINESLSTTVTLPTKQETETQCKYTTGILSK